MFPQEIEGKKALLDAFVEGDFIARTTFPLDRQVERLGVILRDECKLPVRLSLREVDRDVVVAKGRYSYRPTEGKKVGVHVFDIYGLTRQERGDIGPGGTFDEMLRWAGSFTEPHTRVVNEATGLPNEEVRWKLHARRTLDERMRLEDHDKVACSPQTGPSGMRVILALEGRRTFDEAYPPLARADHPQAP